MMAVMNRYGVMAKDHWARWLPTRYATLVASGQVEAFFTDLGEQAAARVAALADSMAETTPEPPDSGYLERAGRLRAIQQAAEEQVLAELVLLPAEQAEGEQEVEDDEAGWAAVRAQMTEDYMPLDPRHRLYRDLEDESVTPEVFAARHRAWLASLAPPPPEETTPPDATTAPEATTPPG